MPLYTPKTSETEFRGGKNILASEHFQFIEGAGTLDATKFDTGYNEAGLIIAKNKTSGKFEDVQGVGAGDDDIDGLDAYEDFGILNVDFDNDGENDVVAGEIIVRGSVYELKLVGEVTDAFKAANPMIRYVK